MKIGDVIGRSGYDVAIAGKTDWTAGMTGAVKAQLQH
jgi:hypothetical protein